jgi:hypothetical protein
VTDQLAWRRWRIRHRRFAHALDDALRSDIHEEPPVKTGARQSAGLPKHSFGIRGAERHERLCGCSHSHQRRRHAPCRTSGCNLSPALDLDVVLLDPPSSKGLFVAGPILGGLSDRLLPHRSMPQHRPHHTHEVVGRRHPGDLLPLRVVPLGSFEERPHRRRSGLRLPSGLGDQLPHDRRASRVM